MQSAAQGSPLSPANTSIGRGESMNPSGFQSHSTSQPATLPPTPPLQKRKTTTTTRINTARAPEPTLETYRKISPNTYATNTVWNDRRDSSLRAAAAAAADPSQPRRTILIKSN